MAGLGFLTLFGATIFMPQCAGKLMFANIASGNGSAIDTHAVPELDMDTDTSTTTKKGPEFAGGKSFSDGNGRKTAKPEKEYMMFFITIACSFAFLMALTIITIAACRSNEGGSSTVEEEEDLPSRKTAKVKRPESPEPSSPSKPDSSPAKVLSSPSPLNTHNLPADGNPPVIQPGDLGHIEQMAELTPSQTPASANTPLSLSAPPSVRF